MTQEELKDSLRIDYLLLGISLTLVIVGVIMVYSASAHLAARRFNNSFYFVQKQMAFALLGLIVMGIFRFIPYQAYQRWVYWLLAITFFLLVLVLIPGLGVRIGGASRWFRLGGISFQPSEFSKLVLVIFLSYYLAKHRDQVKTLTHGLVVPGAVVLVLVALILQEPDLGMDISLIMISAILLFVGGTRLRHLLLAILPLIPMGYFLIWKVPYRKMRVLSYLDPWKDPLGSGFHLKHSFLAFGSGGLTGQGLGGSQQKLFYLPEPHTDFVFSIVGEEFGFLGVAFLTTLYLILVVKSLRLALRGNDLFGVYLTAGISVIIGFQAFINILVVMGLLPTKGLTLPFVSYGGTSLLLNLICIGILMNISAQQEGEKECAS
jgi:cell division protein FtsW